MGLFDGEQAHFNNVRLHVCSTRTIANMDLAAKAALLDETLQSCGSLMVAYSGGTDSAFLAFAAHRVLGNRMLAVIADSPSLPRKELQQALDFCETMQIPLQTLHTSELSDTKYRQNDANRCFYCKDELFKRMELLREHLGFDAIAFGMNTDDRGDHRPGQTAAQNHHILAPLVLAQLSKLDIRQLAQNAGLRIHDKPASACLSSRLAYGLPVTAERLSQVEQAEDLLHAMGFRQVRVRHHDTLARIEIAREDLPRAFDLSLLDNISNSLKALGFTFVALDAQGYRSGSMNSLLPASAITSASHA